MDLFDVIRACFRRWYVVVPVLLLSALFAYTKFTSVKPVYYSQAVVGLAPPNAQIQWAQPGEAIPRNGLLEGGGPVLLANMVVFGLREPSVVQQVVAAGGKPQYWAKMFPMPEMQNQLPLIMVESSQPDANSARQTVDLVVAQADSVLRDIQQRAGVGEKQFVRALVTAPASQPTPAVPSRTRSTASIFLAGFGLSVIAGVVVDVLLLRRRDRRLQSFTQSEPVSAEDAVSVKTPVRTP